MLDGFHLGMSERRIFLHLSPLTPRYTPRIYSNRIPNVTPTLQITLVSVVCNLSGGDKG